jgi:hypothetical protein
MDRETHALESEFLVALRDLIQLLQGIRRSGVLIGGVAVGLLGYSRATADIDMIIEGTGIDLTDFLEQARTAGFEPFSADEP